MSDRKTDRQTDIKTEGTCADTSVAISRITDDFSDAAYQKLKAAAAAAAAAVVSVA